MHKKLIAFVLVLGLLTALVGPAQAGKKKKKKKGPKPYTSEEVTVQAGHPAFYSTAGTPVLLTAQDFENSCDIPSSNGVDAYVWEVPEDYIDVQATISAFGSGGPEGYDLDMFLYDEGCAPVMAFQATGTDETGVLMEGTRYILIHNYTGGPTNIYFELKA